MTTEIQSRTTEEILEEIRGLQEIQKTHPPTTEAWETAGELLAPLFEEMARREPADEIGTRYTDRDLRALAVAEIRSRRRETGFKFRFSHYEIALSHRTARGGYVVPTLIAYGIEPDSGQMFSINIAI